MNFVGIAAHDTDAAMAAFVDEFSLEAMPTLVDDDGDLWARFGVRAQPAWAFVDADGEVRVVAGALYGDALDQRIAELLAGH